MVRYGFKNFPFKKIVLELIVHVIYFCHLLWKNSPTVFIKNLENSVFFNEKKISVFNDYRFVHNNFLYQVNG